MTSTLPRKPLRLLTTSLALLALACSSGAGGGDGGGDGGTDLIADATPAVDAIPGDAPDASLAPDLPGPTDTVPDLDTLSPLDSGADVVPPFVPPSPAVGYYDEMGDWGWWYDHLPLLAENGHILFLGMGADQLGNPDLLAVLRKAEELGLEVRAWILLDHDIGYWPGETNAEPFAEAAIAFADWFLAEELAIRWIVVDMETDIDTTLAMNKAAAEGSLVDALAILEAHYDPVRFAEATQVYQQMVADLEERGFFTMVVTYPQVLDDLVDGDTGLQDLFDIPVSPVPWHEVSTMVYSTTFQQMSGLTFGPGVVYDYARMTLEYVPHTASIALGVTGDMTDPATLAAEVAAARAAGIERIQIYSYRGSLDHEDPHAWHAALDAQPLEPEPEPNGQVLHVIFQTLDEDY